MPAALDCVAFIVRSGDTILAEKRKSTEELLPGALALPGGHVEHGESIEDGLARELLEELGVVSTRTRRICSLLHQSDELRRIHYFAVEAWTGEIENREAESLHWIAVDILSALDIDVDRAAMAEYLRGCGQI